MHDLLSTSSPTKPKRDAVADLLPYTRQRMIRTRYPQNPPEAAATLGQFQAQVLEIVFGWHHSVEDLVRNEIAHAAQGEPRRKWLAKWLDKTVPEVINDPDKIQDTKKCAEAYTRSRNVHAAVYMLLQSRLYDQAVGLYKTSDLYMEAVLVAFLYMPHREYQTGLLADWASAEEHRSPTLASR
ncbi:hypothetical protein SEUCBS140593_010448, partial [Sporothrix eucalyptigena]